jgi:hypothetical protein
MPVCFPANKSIAVFHTRAMHAVEEDSPRPDLHQESPVTSFPPGAGLKVHNGPGLRSIDEPISHSSFCINTHLRATLFAHTLIYKLSSLLSSSAKFQ